MSLLIKNIQSLVGVEDRPKKKLSGREMSSLNSIDNAFLLIEDGLIKEFGKSDESKISSLKSQISNLKSHISHLQSQIRNSQFAIRNS